MAGRCWLRGLRLLRVGVEVEVEGLSRVVMQISGGGKWKAGESDGEGLEGEGARERKLIGEAFALVYVFREREEGCCWVLVLVLVLVVDDLNGQ